MLVAPAGFGKTRLARALASTWPRTAYCDAFGVKSASDFATNLIASIGDLDPVRGVELAQSTIAAAGEAALLLQAARAAWRADRPGPCVMVLDHIDEALHEPHSRAFLNSLLERAHPQQCLILCSRVRPVLRASRFAAPHESLAIGVEDLRFTIDDIRNALPSATSDEDCLIVERVTRGWPVGVLFMARAAERNTLESVAGRIERSPPQPLEDYVVQEVLSEADDVLLATLRACASIPDCTLQDVAYALGCTTEEAKERLSSSAFIASNGGQGTYDVHPLLRTTILQHFPAQTTSLIAKAAAAHRASGDAVRAAKLYQTIGDLVTAGDCLDALDSYFLGSPSIELAQIVAKLEPTLMLSHPRLWSAATLARVYSISLQQWLNEARTVWAALDDRANLEVRAGVVGAYANVTGVLGLFKEGLGALERFRAALSTEEMPLGEMILELWRVAFEVWQGKLCRRRAVHLAHCAAVAVARNRCPMDVQRGCSPPSYSRGAV